jgi:hypothetical protein
MSLYIPGLAAAQTYTTQFANTYLPTFVTNTASSIVQGVSSAAHSTWNGTEERVPPFEKLINNLSLFRQGSAHQHTIEQTLMEDLKGIETAYPELSGLAQYVEAHKETKQLIDCIEKLVTEFLTSELENTESPLYLKLMQTSNSL